MKKTPITNKEILQNVSHGSREKKIGSDAKHFFYIYKTTCAIIPNMVFVSGCISDIDPDIDTHVCKSFPGRKKYRISKPKPFTYGWYLRQHGEMSFKRKDLLFFDTLEELLKAEQLILTDEFCDDERVISSRNYDYAEIRKWEWHRTNGFLTDKEKSFLSRLAIPK